MAKEDAGLAVLGYSELVSWKESDHCIPMDSTYCLPFSGKCYYLHTRIVSVPTWLPCCSVNVSHRVTLICNICCLVETLIQSTL